MSIARRTRVGSSAIGAAGRTQADQSLTAVPLRLVIVPAPTEAHQDLTAVPLCLAIVPAPAGTDRI